MAPSPLKRSNISNDICHLIREEIAVGVLPPGEHLNEVHLAEKLDVSRTPLREALSQLTAEGLIECKPRRGFFAKSLTVDEVKQLYPLRAILDPQALRMAGIPDQKHISELRRINEQIAKLKGSPGPAIDLDNKWHRALLSECPNRILLDFIDQLIWKTSRYEYAYLSQKKNIEIATNEHDAILLALEKTDLPAACKMLKQNMTSARKPLIAWLESRDTKQ